MDWTLFIGWSTLVIALIGSIVGLFFNWWAIRESNQTRDLELFNSVFNSIIESEEKLYSEYKGKDPERKKEWDSLHFNKIEYFAFLVNRNLIKNKDLPEFFKDAVIQWYEEIFLNYFSPEKIKDKKCFPEFKKLYTKYKG